MYQKSVVHYMTKLMVDVGFYAGIVCCFMAPYFVKKTRGYLWQGDSVMLPFSIFLLVSGICGVYILFNLKKMFRTLLGGNPFVLENVSSFRKMAVASFTVALVYIVKCWFWFTMATGVLVVVFVIAGLFCLTLKDIFKQAVYYKQEHDYTV